MDQARAGCIFLDTGLKSARLRRLIDTSVVRIEQNQFSNDVPLCVFITEYLICICCRVATHRQGIV